MDMALNMGAFEALDRSELMKFEGGYDAVDAFKDFITVAYYAAPYYAKMGDSLYAYSESHGWNDAGSKHNRGGRS